MFTSKFSTWGDVGSHDFPNTRCTPSVYKLAPFSPRVVKHREIVVLENELFNHTTNADQIYLNMGGKDKFFEISLQQLVQ